MVSGGERRGRSRLNRHDGLAGGVAGIAGEIEAVGRHCTRRLEWQRRDSGG
jgi:hypothetical protein